MLAQVHLGLAGVAVVEVAVADAFEGAGFFGGGAEVPGNGGGVSAGDRLQYAKVAEGFSLAKPSCRTAW